MAPAQRRRLAPPIRILIGGTDKHSGLCARSAGKCVQGALDSVENTADIAAHQRQSADREDGNEAEDNAVLDHTLAFFFANQIHEELHELLTFPDREVEVEPVVSLRVPAKARFRN